MSVIFLPPNSDAKSKVGPWCLLALVVLVPVVLWARDDAGSGAAAFGAASGAVLAKVLAPALLVVLVARKMEVRWPTWWYAAAVLTPGVVLVLAIDVVPARMAAAEAADARVEQARHLALPAQLGGWEAVVGSDVDARGAAVRDQLSQSLSQAPVDPGEVDFVYGEYRGQRTSFAILGFTTGDGAFGRDLSKDSDEALSAFLGGMRSLDPVTMDAGSLGGSMSCASGTEIASGAVHCVWSDAVTVAAVFYGEQLGLQAAARQTRKVRSGVTVLD